MAEETAIVPHTSDEGGATAENSTDSWQFASLSEEEYERLKEQPLELLRAVEAKLSQEHLATAALQERLDQNETFLNDAVQEQEKLLEEKSQLLATVQQMKEAEEAAAEEDADTAVGSLRIQLREFKSLHADALLSIQKRTEQCESLKTELRKQESAHADLVGEHSATSQKLVEFEAETIQLRLLNARLEQKTSSMKEQNGWLEKRLSEQSDEIQSLQSRLSSARNSTKAELDKVTRESIQYKELHESSKRSAENLQKQVASLIARIENKETEFTYEKTQFANTIGTKDKLIELYKGKAEESEKELSDLRDRFASVEKILTENKENYEQELVVSQERTALLHRQLREAEETIKELELRHQKDTRIGELLLDTGSGTPRNQVFLAEIASKYEEKCKELLAERSEHRRKSQYLEKLLAEVEEKTPLIQKQQAEFMRVKTEKDLVAKQLERALEQIATTKQQYQDKLKENYVIRTQLEESGKQLDLLLKLQQVPTPQGTSTSAEQSVDNSQAVMDLLALRQRNEELLGRVNELEFELREKTDAQLDEKYDSAIKEIERLQKTQEVLEARVKGLVRDKNEYCQLYKQLRKELEDIEAHGRLRASSDSDDEPRPLPAPTSTDTDIALLEKEFESVRGELQTELRKANAELLGTRQELSLKREELAEVRSKLELLTEKYAKYEENTGYLQKELNLLRDQVARYSTTTAHQEQQLETANERVASQRAEILKQTRELARLTAEKDTLREVKERLEKETATHLADKRRFEELISTMQTMQKNSETSNVQRISRLEGEVTSYKEECSQLRAKIDEHFQTHRGELSDLETRLKEKKISLHNATSALTDLKGKYEVAVANEKSLREHLDITKKQVENTEEKIQLLLQAKASGQDPSAALLKKKLEDAQTEATDLAEKLATAEESERMWKLTAQQSNDTIADQSSELNRIRTERKAAEQELKKSIDELTCERQSLEEKVSELQQQIENARSELEASNARCEDLSNSAARKDKEIDQQRQRIEELIEQVATLDTNWKNVQERYQHEFRQRVEDMELNEQLKKEIARLKEDTLQAVEKADEQEQIAKKLLFERDGVEKQHQCKENMLNERIQSLEQQNSLLHSQLQDMSMKAEAIEARMREADVDNGVTSPTTERSPDSLVKELRELVRYMKREKDIVQCKYDLAEQELVKLRTQSKLALDSAEKYRAKLEEIQRTTSTAVEEQADHAQVMEQLQQLDVLRESNVTLRAASKEKGLEIDRLKTEIADLVSKLEPLERQTRSQEAVINSLRMEKEELEANNENWRNRVQSLLNKYERIDPEEYRLLQENLASTGKALDEAVAENQRLSKEVETATEQLTQLKIAITSAEATHSQQEEQLKAQSAELARQTSLVATHKDQVEKLKVIARRHAASKKEIAAKYDELIVNYAAAEKAVSDTKERNQKLLSELTTAKEDASTAQTQYLELKKRVVQSKRNAAAKQKQLQQIQQQRTAVASPAAAAPSSPTQQPVQAPSVASSSAPAAVAAPAAKVVAPTSRVAAAPVLAPVSNSAAAVAAKTPTVQPVAQAAVDAAQSGPAQASMAEAAPPLTPVVFAPIKAPEKPQERQESKLEALRRELQQRSRKRKREEDDEPLKPAKTARKTEAETSAPVVASDQPATAQSQSADSTDPLSTADADMEDAPSALSTATAAADALLSSLAPAPLAQPTVEGQPDAMQVDHADQPSTAADQQSADQQSADLQSVDQRSADQQSAEASMEGDMAIETLVEEEEESTPESGEQAIEDESVPASAEDEAMEEITAEAPATEANEEDADEDEAEADAGDADEDDETNSGDEADAEADDAVSQEGEGEVDGDDDDDDYEDDDDADDDQDEEEVPVEADTAADPAQAEPDAAEASGSGSAPVFAPVKAPEPLEIKPIKAPAPIAHKLPVLHGATPPPATAPKGTKAKAKEAGIAARVRGRRRRGKQAKQQ